MTADVGVMPSMAAEACAALGLRLAAVDAANGRLAWRSAGFAETLPEFAPGRRAAELGCEFEPMRRVLDGALADGAAEGVLALSAGRTFELTAARDDGRLFLTLDDAAAHQAAWRRRLEDREQLLLTTRMISVGEVATLLAHELNQPLGAVANLLRGLRSRLERGALAREAALEAIERATEQALYASGVVARIRAFVEQRQPRAERLDLARLARSTVELLDWELERDRVEPLILAAADLPSVTGDPVMIQQVLVNLARNGLDAMRACGDGGRRLVFEVIAAGAEVEIRVTDAGGGVPEAAADRLFAPFLSTKPDGMGVGLGVCRSIVELHGGRLWFTRPPAGGTTFHLALPCSGAMEPIR